MKQSIVACLLFTILFASATGTDGVSYTSTPLGLSIGSSDVYGADLSYDIYQEIDLASYRNYIIKLTENGSRWTSLDDGITFSDANVHARNWIVQELERVSEGRIEIEILGDYKSVIGVLPGWASGNAPVFMVGGHYDSVPGAPGANDDGTGVAAALELARVMSQYRWALDIYFCFWNSEEIGLWGSWEVTNIFHDRDLALLHYYNVDMLLVDDPEGASDKQFLAVYNTYAPFHESKYYAYLMKALSNNIGINIVDPTPSTRFFGWERSDHYSFIRSGYNQVSFLFESGFDRDDAYHQPADVWNNPLYNYTVATEAVRCIGASMAFTMSYAPLQLSKMSYDGTLQPGQNRAYLVPISTPTDVAVYSNWTGGELEFTLRDPSNTIVDEACFIDGTSEMIEALNGAAESAGLYKVMVNNPGDTSTSYSVSIRYDADLNGDDVLDSQQYWFDPIMFSLDLDNDGLSDGLEKLIGTSRINSDTDDDGMPDGWEYYNGLDPLVDDSMEDPDDDGLTNLEEYTHGTDPQNPDSDSDDMPDGWEIEHGLDPLTDDAADDPDGDGFSNLEEFVLGQDPNSSDIAMENTTEDSEAMTLHWYPLIVAAGAAGCVIIFGIALLKRRGI